MKNILCILVFFFSSFFCFATGRVSNHHSSNIVKPSAPQLGQFKETERDALTPPNDVTMHIPLRKATLSD